MAELKFKRLETPQGPEVKWTDPKTGYEISVVKSSEYITIKECEEVLLERVEEYLNGK